MVIVDCQSHVFPEAYAELLSRNPGPLIARRERGRSGEPVRYRIDYGGLQQFTLDLEPYDPTAKLRAMDAAGVDISVLSVNIPGPEWLVPELAAEGAHICNDYLGALCSDHPDRFLGLASLPLQDVPAAVTELKRAAGTLGLRGALLPSHVAGPQIGAARPLDAPEFEPLYAAAESLGLPLVLHPTVSPWHGTIQDYSMIPMYGFMVDTSTAMLRLILSGVLERHPRLLLVHPHAGGVLPYVMGRVVEQTEVKRRGREHITQSPEAYYRRVYFDLASPSVLALRYIYDFAGPDRLLFGSDHPWVPIDALLKFVGQLHVSKLDRAKIMGQNAISLFRIGQ